MIGALISLVLTLVIAGVVYWAVMAIIGLLPLPDPIPRVIQIIMILIIALIVIYALMAIIPGVGHYPLLR
jgi:hypothetical protein